LLGAEGYSASEHHLKTVARYQLSLELLVIDSPA